MRLLPVGNSGERESIARSQSLAEPRRDRGRAVLAPVPLRSTQQDSGRGRACRHAHAGAGMIPPSLQANPVLERWVSFPSAGRVRIAFGKVEYGQGVMTSLAQIAAEELDVAMERLIVVGAATGAVPDEGMTV